MASGLRRFGDGLGRVDNATGVAVGEFRNERYLLVAQFALVWGVQYFSVHSTGQ